MNKRFKVVSALGVITLAALLGVAWPPGHYSNARAQSAPAIEITPTSAAPGESITIRGSGWPVGASVVPRLSDPSIPDRSSPLGGSFQVDSGGSFSGQGTVPNTLFGGGSRGWVSVVPGSYVITVSIPDGPSASAPFTIGAPAGSATLWGQVFFDTNGNGQQDQGDEKAGEFTSISVASTSPGSTIKEARTDSIGRYLLTALEPGSYRINGKGSHQSSVWEGSVVAQVKVGEEVKMDLLLERADKQPKQERYFPETGFSIDNDHFWDYFTHRGGIRTLGYPISRTFQFQGFPTQFFQRLVLQYVPGEGVQRLNLLDPGLLPYTHINGSQFPPVMEEVKQATPRADQPGYDTAVIDFIRQFAPNQFQGRQTGFFDAFMGSVTSQDAFPGEGGHDELLPLLNMEIWGVPTSKPTPDPNNSNFIYLRFQRGILHYQGNDPQGKPITEGILLGDWFKSLITGQNLPSDLESQAREDRSPYLRQYDKSKPNWIARPEQLPDTNFSFAFEPR